MDREDIKEAAVSAIQYVLDGDHSSAMRIVRDLLDTGDPRAVYGACGAWAGSGEVALEATDGKRAAGDWTLFDIHPSGLAGTAEETFGLRFVTAYCNADWPTTAALFNAASSAGGKQFQRSVVAVLAVGAELNARVTR
ncbi:hypothetical protein OG709_30040 [Streptomyces sp. NBC_01267]|uniref:hypothetical protein n=1 Tax=Streptomyces sp. NBC_01267 TaxID=2903805 RepID=UPI002E34C9FD|nr:hypothetical protein [Streptomyces sp. NBC_01267]